jgi:transposase
LQRQENIFKRMEIDIPRNTLANWMMRSGAPDHPVVLYDYARSRAGSVVENLLTGFSGYLQTDDYAGYHAVGRKHDISHLGCWGEKTRFHLIDVDRALNYFKGLN